MSGDVGRRVLLVILSERVCASVVLVRVAERHVARAEASR